jgi:dihydrofolate reductase
LILSLIAAVDERGGIGKDNRLPWRLSADLMRFKALTMGHHLIMGRKTYASIGRVLPGRTTIVLTRNPYFAAEGVLVAAFLQQAIELAEERGEQEAFIIGGAEVFRESLPLADRLYLTRVHASLPADVFFPEIDPEEWALVESQFHPADENNEYPFTYYFYKRREPAG